MRNDTRIVRPGFLIAAIVAGVVVLISLVLRPQNDENWRHHIHTSFAGITNTPAGSFAVISISNRGSRSVKFWGPISIEYVGIPPPALSSGLTYLVRAVPAGTNLVVAASGRADFFLAVPSEGNSWIARLTFAQVGLVTELREYILRTRKLQFLPKRLRGLPVEMVTQPFTTKATLSQPVQQTKVSPPTENTK